MSKIYLYADEASQRVLASQRQKIIAIGGDFGYGNFGDVLQHINALKGIKASGKYETISVMAANAISHQDFPSWVPSAYKTDAVIFVSDYPLILSESDPKLRLVLDIRNVSGLCLYGGGFLNAMWGDYVLSVVEHFLKQDERIAYWVSGQQITTPFETRVLEHIKEFNPFLFGVRDELSLQMLVNGGFAADYSFDDATEALVDLTKKVQLRSGQGLFLHINSSDYTANHTIQDKLAHELALLSVCPASKNGVTVFQAFRDTRQEVFDSTETIKQLDYGFPFHDCHLVDLVGLLFDNSGKDTGFALEGEFGYSCSYHVTLWLQLAGIPCWLRSSNSFYDQKASALQVTQDLLQYVRAPKLADHRSNLERRAAWNEKLQLALCRLPEVENSLQFVDDGKGPAPWPFFYKGTPSLQQKLNDAQKSDRWQRERADLAEHQLGELRGRTNLLAAQLDVILASRSWQLTRGLRVIGRLLRGEGGLVRDALRRIFKRNH